MNAGAISRGSRKMLTTEAVRPVSADAAQRLDQAHQLAAVGRGKDAQKILRAVRSKSGQSWLWHRTSALAYAVEYQLDQALSEIRIAAGLLPYDTLTKGCLRALESLVSSDPSCLAYITERVWKVPSSLPGTRLHKSANEEIRRSILRSANLRWQEDDLSQPVRGGWQAGILSEGEIPSFAPLEEAIRHGLRAFLAQAEHVRSEIGVSPSWPSSLSMWPMVLAAGGNITPHLHPRADVSGVYYVDVPDSILDGEMGALKFVTHPPEFTPPGYPEGQAHCLTPRTGDLVFFPSNLWHMTVPFESDALRISVAFDVIFSLSSERRQP